MIKHYIAPLNFPLRLHFHPLDFTSFFRPEKRERLGSLEIYCAFLLDHLEIGTNGRKPNWPGAISTTVDLSKLSRALLDSREWESAKINLQKSLWVAKIVAFTFGKESLPQFPIPEGEAHLAGTWSV